MRRTSFLGAGASLCLLLGGAACGGDDDGGADSKAENISQLSEELQNGGDGLAKEDADCAAEIFVDEVGVDALKDLDLTADEPPEDLKDDFAAAAARLDDECDITGLGG